MIRHSFFLLVGLLSIELVGQTNPLWTEQKAKNYLPHMTVPEVKELLSKSDLVIIPIGALEQHGNHLPIGTDFINGLETSKLIAFQRDVLVAPVLMVGQSPYHMEFAGTITLSAETIIQVHMEAVESLIKHGFKRFIFMNSHGGNKAITGLIVDQVNQKTSGVAVNFTEAVKPFLESSQGTKSSVLDRHAGTGETSRSLYLMPNLVQIEKAYAAELALPEHLRAMVPLALDGDQTALMLFLVEGLKQKETGKKTSSAEMSETGVWGERDPKESTAQRGEKETTQQVNAAVKFIDRWNELLEMASKD